MININKIEIQHKVETHNMIEDQDQNVVTKASQKLDHKD
jgi:hypothetical protein